MIQTNVRSKKSIFAAFIDLEKAFDWVDHDILFLHNNINGKMFKAKRHLHKFACMKIDSYYNTDWFEINNGVPQGYTLSPTVFSFFTNDLAEVKRTWSDVNIDSGYGIDFNSIKICILLYIVLIADSESELQSMLNVM